MIVARAPDSELILEYAKRAEVAIVVERGLHESFLKDFGLTDDEIAGADPSPTTLAYMGYFLSTAHAASFEEAAAALLPCFWVYREAGLAIAAKSKPNNPYQAWIDTSIPAKRSARPLPARSESPTAWHKTLLKRPAPPWPPPFAVAPNSSGCFGTAPIAWSAGRYWRNPAEIRLVFSLQRCDRSVESPTTHLAANNQTTREDPQNEL